ncbi:hypothetical protein BDR06DRAFT_976920 [Suillus hirtellus]|nr:hypothetical protein BDR06DRAFT_976920 [Suillus hirtellus]
MIATQCFPSEGSGGAGHDDKDLDVLPGSFSKGMILECMSQSKAVERGQSEGASTVSGVYTVRTRKLALERQTCDAEFIASLSFQRKPVTTPEQHLKLIGGELTAGESDTLHEAQIVSIDFDIPSTSWLHVLEAKASQDGDHPRKHQRANWINTAILGTNRPINAYNAWR